MDDLAAEIAAAREAQYALEDAHGDPADCWCCTGDTRGRHCELCHDEEDDVV